MHTEKNAGRFFGWAWVLAVIALTGCSEHKHVAVLFVGHGEPASFNDGNVSRSFWDGTPLGPSGVTLGVPWANQNTEWGAAYEEIATAMMYSFVDYNENGIPYELLPFPMGDVPPFFTWDIFYQTVAAQYAAVGDYSPHNDLLVEHVDAVQVGALGKYVDKYVAFLDAYPRIPDVIHEIASDSRYEKIVVVPLLLSRSSHSQEIEEMAEEWIEKERPMEIVVTEPFYDIPFARKRIASAVSEMARMVRTSIPDNVPDEEIGVVLAAHGTSYVPPYAEFGYVEGNPYSHLYITEQDFHRDVRAKMNWEFRTGRINFSTPTVEEAIAAFEAAGKSHVMVIPTAFKTASIHTMWDISMASVGRPVLPAEGVVSRVTETGMTIWMTPAGYADLSPGDDLLRASMRFTAEMGLLTLFENNRETFLW